jgi:hypothetical protein
MVLPFIDFSSLMHLTFLLSPLPFLYPPPPLDVRLKMWEVTGSPQVCGKRAPNDSSTEVRGSPKVCGKRAPKDGSTSKDAGSDGLSGGVWEESSQGRRTVAAVER